MQQTTIGHSSPLVSTDGSRERDGRGAFPGLPFYTPQFGVSKSLHLSSTIVNLIVNILNQVILFCRLYKSICNMCIYLSLSLALHRPLREFRVQSLNIYIICICIHIYDYAHTEVYIIVYNYLGIFLILHSSELRLSGMISLYIY